jgi:hypothetical protein
MKKIIDFFKKVDTFVEVWSHKVPYLIFDALVIIVASIFAIIGIISMFFCSWYLGIIFIIIIYGISTYLIMKRHKKHLDKWIN